MKSLFGLLRKETLHIVRDRRTLTVLLLLPIIQVVIFGYAIRTDVDNVRIAIVDPRPDEMTLRLRDRFTAAHVFRTVAVLRTTSVSSRAAARDPGGGLDAPPPRSFAVFAAQDDSLDALFRDSTAQAAIVFEPKFAEHVARGLPARVMIITDSTEPNTGSTIQGYAERVIQQFEREIRANAGALQIVPQARLRFNPTAESKNLFVPGLMAFILTIISSLMTAITIAREKETGTMETLLVSPLRPWQIIIGKVAPYLALGFISVVGVLIEARVIFNVPLRGSITLLLLEGLLYILVSLSLGVLISARTASQRVAMMGALVGTMLPTMILSGFIFPIESMPAPLRWLSNIVPAKWFVTIARGIMLKGIGLSYLWQDTLVLLIMAVFLLAVSTRSFSERLE